MAQYMIEYPHTPEECLDKMDELSKKSEKLLSKFVWGCNAGVHKGWATVDAKSESEIKEMLPASMRDKVTITMLNKMSRKDIEEAHKQMAMAGKK